MNEDWLSEWVREHFPDDLDFEAAGRDVNPSLLRAILDAVRTADIQSLGDDQSVAYAADRLRYYFPQSLGTRSGTAAVVAVSAYLEHRASLAAVRPAGTPPEDEEAT